MSCTNCFNGCAETISDQCVKYTGENVPALGISTGDSLLSVENAITNFLVPAINGTGIKPIIDPNIICDIVKLYLPPCTTCTGFTLNEILTAIVKTVCDLQEQIDDIDDTLTALNANYTIGCLTGVTASSDTHDIVQATINKLCSLNTAFSALVAQLNATNVTSLNVDTYIANYLANEPSANLISNKMVPYTPIPFYPTPAFLTGKFDSTGAGIGNWTKIYLCNGNNSTPDLRGRTLVGATSGMGGGAMNAAVDPNIVGSGNPNYLLGTLSGTNQVTLTVGEIPNHTHVNTATAVAAPHSHFVANSDVAAADSTITATNYINKQSTFGSYSYKLAGSITVPTVGKTSNVTDTITVTMTNGAIGGGGAHANNQPSIGCYYIMYIP